MNRLNTMARFAEPVAEETQIAICAKCDEPLYEGESAVKFEDETFCDFYCLHTYYNLSEEIL